jgi:hypothetical protein
MLDQVSMPGRIWLWWDGNSLLLAPTKVRLDLWWGCPGNPPPSPWIPRIFLVKGVCFLGWFSLLWDWGRGLLVPAL